MPQLHRVLVFNSSNLVTFLIDANLRVGIILIVSRHQIILDYGSQHDPTHENKEPNQMTFVDIGWNPLHCGIAVDDVNQRNY